MSYKILVTGGAGYLGSILVPELLAQGHHVTVLDNFMFRQNSLAHVCYHEKFSVVNGDIRVESVTKPLVQDADIIIPLAALVGAPLCNKDPVGATSTNRDAIFAMVNWLSKEQWLSLRETDEFRSFMSRYGFDDSWPAELQSRANGITNYTKVVVKANKD